MKSTITVLLLLACLCGGQGAAAQTPDYAREQRITDEIVPSIVVGDPVRLPGPDNRSFLGIYTPAAGAKAAAVLVHGYGVHPDWGLIGELRSNLADAGYATLSIQMPVLAAEKKPEDYLPLFPDAALRIAAAVDFLRAKGYRKIALVSHSLGSRMSNEYLAGAANQYPYPVTAWVAISIPADYHDVDKIRIPVFDLYGENDLPVVLADAPRRALALEKIRGARVTKLPQADHFYDGKYKELDAAVRGFLDEALR
jgi:pimeloyl-ACP methyl ester carboxylesterase